MEAPIEPLETPVRATADYALWRAVCGVCGEGFTEQPTICPQCDAPHHDGCWRYLGGCATYGCPARAAETGPRFSPPSRCLPRTLERVVLPDGPAADDILENLGVAFGLVGVASAAAGLVAGLGAAGGGMLLCWILSAHIRRNTVVDVQRGKVLAQTTLFGRVVDERDVCPLEGVKSLEVARAVTADGRVEKRLVAWLRSGAPFELTDVYYPNTPSDRSVDHALVKLERTTDLRVYSAGRAVSPLAEAMADALKRTLPLRKRPR